MDALACTLIATAITCAYYLLGVSVLKQLNVLPQGMKVVEQVSLIFTETIGGWPHYIFMFGGFCTLFFTLLVFTASAGHTSVDFTPAGGCVFPPSGGSPPTSGAHSTDRFPLSLAVCDHGEIGHPPCTGAHWGQYQQPAPDSHGLWRCAFGHADGEQRVHAAVD